MASEHAQALVTGIWCATVRVPGREQMLALEHPTWIDSWSDPRTMGHTVRVEWFGAPLQVSGVHVGPQAGQHDWEHRFSNPNRHWNLRWSPVLEEPGVEPGSIDADLANHLPSQDAWYRTGEWLLGAELALCNMGVARRSSPFEDSDWSTWWDFFCRGFEQ